ncbi:calcium-binding protein [Sinorhizobium numidicum]|uniref:Calcium-binding protein n=1 Tax=Sinorhizobium numidicum TaxID=680248 RepID=A0ABY8CR01_9HYPH|nr:calcium-binding protein [Sinorhizobium numidicum]WEX74611.1 calcium-binding protein [Sinorhizobium numidicum]WEX80602.1 calcium-binding protein [Sinorhizobium numidicum]
MATIVGWYGNDTLRGSEETDYIWGLPGGDNIDAGGGDDFVDGGAESDILTSSSGYDRLDGGAGDDQIFLIGTGGAITGGVGYDGLIIDLSMTSGRLVFNGESGHGIIGYQSANERHIFFHDIEWLRLVAGSGDDRITGTAASDRISTGAGDDVVEAGAGQDIITNTGGHDRLDGGEGNDRFVLVGTGSTVLGGSGDDTLVIDLSAASDQVVFNGENGHGILGYQTPDERHLFFRHYDIERVVLTTGSGNDRIQGSILADVIRTEVGNDVVDAAAGDDMIVDGRGANRLFGGAGNDSITTTLYSAEIDGGLGQDWLRIEERVRTSDATIDFSAGTASTGTVFRGIEQASVALGGGNDTVIAGNLTYAVVYAGAGDDRLVGGAGRDSLHGEGGNDRIDGGGGNDTITTGVGNDVAFGGDGMDTLANNGGRDVLEGGAGDDWFRDATPGGGSLGEGSLMLGGAGNDTFNAYFRGEVDGGEGRDLLQLSLGALPDATDFDAMRGATGTGLTFADIEDFRVTTGIQNDVLRGADGDDAFYALSGNDLLEGRGGNDELRGYSDDDRLFGGDGEDFLDGGPQDDLLSGGNGVDILVGGSGKDTFLWSTESPDQQGIDRILDFDTGSGDVIAFSSAAENNTGIHDYAGFLAASTETAAGVYVAFNGSDTYGLLIEGVSLAAVSANDVVFDIA